MAVVDEGGLSSLGRRIQSQSGVPPPTSFSRSRRRFPHCFLFFPMTRGTPYTIRATLAARRVIDTSVSLPPLPARPLPLPRRPRRRGASATSRAACSSRPSPPARSPSSSTTRGSNGTCGWRFSRPLYWSDRRGCGVLRQSQKQAHRQPRLLEQPRKQAQRQPQLPEQPQRRRVHRGRRSLRPALLEQPAAVVPTPPKAVTPIVVTQQLRQLPLGQQRQVQRSVIKPPRTTRQKTQRLVRRSLMCSSKSVITCARGTARCRVLLNKAHGTGQSRSQPGRCEKRHRR